MKFFHLQKYILWSCIHLDSFSSKEKVPIVLSDHMHIEKHEIVENWMSVETFIAEKLIIKDFVNFELVYLLEMLT